MSNEISSEGAADEEGLYAENSYGGLEEAAAEEKSERTIDGAAAIIYHETPEGNVEFYLEEKPSDYAIEMYRGKLSFVGGTIETKDDSQLDALIRELSEEVESKEAQDILIAELRRTQNLYEVASEQVNGKTAKIYYYTLRIDSDEDWEIVRNSPLTHDAGPKIVLSLGDILSREEDDFAFSMGGVMFSFIKDNYPDRYKEVLVRGMPSYAGFGYTPNKPLTILSPLEATVRDPYANLTPKGAIPIGLYPCMPKTNLLHKQYPIIIQVS